MGSNRGRGAILKSSNGVVLGNTFRNNKLTAFQVMVDFQFLEVSLQPLRRFQFCSPAQPIHMQRHATLAGSTLNCASVSRMPLSKSRMHCRLTL